MKYVWALCGLVLAAPASAQSADVNKMISAAAQAAQMIDQNREPEIWDGFSPVVKAIVTKDQFVSQIRKVRIPLGAAKSRTWISASAAAISGAQRGQVNGQFVTVDFSTIFADNKRVTEKFSFRFDDDKVWRLAGYVEQ